MNICILCPFYNEKDYLLSFLDSINRQTIFNNKYFSIKVILIDGNSNDGSTVLLNSYIDNISFFHLINYERYVSNALNYGIEFSRKFNPDYLIRMDMHAVYPIDYIDLLIKGVEKLKGEAVKVGNYGGVINTVPSTSSVEATIIAKTLSSKFGMGSSIFRTGALKLTSVDTVPFGCFPMEVFNEIGIFDTDLIRNQDDEFNGRIKRAGYKIFLDPKITVNYYARDKFSKVYTMFFQYGYFKPFVNSKLGKPATLRQFIPPIFVLSLALSLLLLLYSFIPLTLLFAIYILYALAFYLIDVKPLLGKFSLIWLTNSFICLFIVHFSYGYGYIMGLKDLCFRKAPNLVGSSR